MSPVGLSFCVMVWYYECIISYEITPGIPAWSAYIPGIWYQVHTGTAVLGVVHSAVRTHIVSYISPKVSIYQLLVSIFMLYLVRSTRVGIAATARRQPMLWMQQYCCCTYRCDPIAVSDHFYRFWLPPAVQECWRSVRSPWTRGLLQLQAARDVSLLSHVGI